MRNQPMENTILDKKIKFTVMNFIFPNLLTTIPLLILSASILFFKLYGEVNEILLICWFTVLITVIVCQCILAIWFQKTKHHLMWENIYYKLFIANAGLVGALWGFSSIVFMLDNSIEQSYLIFSILFIATGGLMYLKGSYLAGSLYSTAVLIPLAGSIYLSSISQSQPQIYFNITLGILSYWIFLLTLNYRLSKLYEEIFTLRLSNKVLTNNLSSKTSELDKLTFIARSKEEKHFSLDLHTHTEHKALDLHQDALTGTDTLQILEIKFLQSRASAHRNHYGLALFCIEVGNYNEVMLTQGQDSADLLLKTVALRLRYCIRETDILARSNTNQFIVIFSDVLFGNEIKTVTNKILKTIAENTVIKDKKVIINLNIGISLYPQDGNDFRDLLMKAGKALSYISSDDATQESHAEIYDQDRMS